MAAGTAERKDAPLAALLVELWVRLMADSKAEELVDERVAL